MSFYKINSDTLEDKWQTHFLKQVWILQSKQINV